MDNHNDVQWSSGSSLFNCNFFLFRANCEAVTTSHVLPDTTIHTKVCNTMMNAFFSFDLFMVYIPECKQQLRTMK